MSSDRISRVKHLWREVLRGKCEDVSYEEVYKGCYSWLFEDHGARKFELMQAVQETVDGALKAQAHAAAMQSGHCVAQTVRSIKEFHARLQLLRSALLPLEVFGKRRDEPAVCLFLNDLPAGVSRAFLAEPSLRAGWLHVCARCMAAWTHLPESVCVAICEGLDESLWPRQRTLAPETRVCLPPS